MISETEAELWSDGEVVSMVERLVISPCDGRFRFVPPQHYTSEGEYVLEGQLIAHIAGTNGQMVPVHSPLSGWVMSFLIREGTPVRSGEPLMSLKRL